MKTIPYIIVLLFISISCKQQSSEYSRESAIQDSTEKSDSLAFVASKKTAASNVNTYTPPAEDPYVMMSSVYAGSPDVESIKSLMEAVLKKYQLPLTDEYRLKVGSVLLDLRKASAVGVTEMEILKHIYQHGSTNITFANQAGLSATILETSK